MKKKIVIATTVLSLAIAGVVSAASIWGTYKGNDIIRLTVGGDPIKVSDVPAISYNDRTMIPIYLLKQAGIDYTWDQKNKTVDISKKALDGFISKSEFNEIYKVMHEHRAFITYMDQIELTSICITLIKNYSSQSQYNQAIEQVNRINIDELDSLTKEMSSLNNKNYKSFQEIADQVYRAKQYLLQGDTQNANSMVLSAKSMMNVVYNVISQEYFNNFLK